MRDKAKIRRFCDELAALWEEKRPNMRFGQLVVTLNRALDKPRHDIFYLEEEEMLDVLRRFSARSTKKPCGKITEESSLQNAGRKR